MQNNILYKYMENTDNKDTFKNFNISKIITDIASYIKKLDIKFSITNIVIIIVISYIIANILSVFKININYTI